MRGDGLGYSGLAGGLAHGSLDVDLMQVMTAGASGARVDGKSGRGKHVLPAPFAGASAVFEGDAVGQFHISVTLGQIRLVNGAHFGDLLPQFLDEGNRQRGDAVLAAFAAAHDDLHEFQIDVLDSQTQSFHESQSGAVEQPHGQAAGVGQGLEESGQLGTRKHNRHTAALLGALHAFDASEVHLQHGPEKEEQRVEGLVLSGGGNAPHDREVVEVVFGLRGVEVLALFRRGVGEEAGDPADVGLLGAVGIVAGADGGADLVDEWGKARRQFTAVGLSLMPGTEELFVERRPPFGGGCGGGERLAHLPISRPRGGVAGLVQELERRLGLLDLPTGFALVGQMLQKGLDIGFPSVHEFARREILPPSHDPIGPIWNQ